MEYLSRLDDFTKDASSFSSVRYDEIESFRIRFLGKKGIIAELFAEFKNLPPDQRRQYGQKINTLKKLVQSRHRQLLKKLSGNKQVHGNDDLTLPGDPVFSGSHHPVSIIRNEIINIFFRLGFSVSEGPEIEDDLHVFTKLNFPPDHPARDMQDTFFIEKNIPVNVTKDILLRTHTSSVQVRVMEKQKPPIRTISPGRVFRNEAISARAHCIFHQVEGLYIDIDVSFAQLKQTLLYFTREMFGSGTDIRFRPSFFPFTEPSAEMDISCLLCGGKGCNVCKYTGWLEILGCGMVDPNVLETNGIDSNIFTGFAFGMGVERIAMLKYQINDLRLYFENDLRFLEQFATHI
ncbi:MAG: phenylalanine--tRNA ligase subunit alpha [Chlorobi bacterium]|nr:phenylalanine--tRNA ligase subunit alpha [Chlorobiota bacterium]